MRSRKKKMWSKEAITLMSGKEEEPKREEVESN